MPLNRRAQHYRHSPHPVPLPLGEGTPEQRAQRGSLSHGERVGVRGVTVVLGTASGD